MEGRIIWKQGESSALIPHTTAAPQAGPVAGLSPSTKRQRKINVLISVDFDAVSGWMGTGQHSDNNLADYSTGFFSALKGVPRLLKLFSRLGISDKVTWFIPGHSMETFPTATRQIVDSGCEIGLHGYAHEV